MKLYETFWFFEDIGIWVLSSPLTQCLGQNRNFFLQVSLNLTVHFFNKFFSQFLHRPSAVLSLATRAPIEHYVSDSWSTLMVVMGIKSNLSGFYAVQLMVKFKPFIFIHANCM